MIKDFSPRSVPSDERFTDALRLLELVRSTGEFRHWVRRELRRCFPHACFVATVGNLYGLGSVPTHRLSVDFPLTLIEELKNNTGAVTDPFVTAWFKTGKVKCVNVESLLETADKRCWKEAMLSYGIRTMLVHGMMDHHRRRFVVFQIVNPNAQDPLEVVERMSRLVSPMAQAVCRCIANSPLNGVPASYGHPTLGLTATELNIIELLAQGLSNKEIARRRGVSDSTVKTQVSRTGAKLGATRRAEIVAIAMPFLSVLPAQNMIDFDDMDSIK